MNRTHWILGGILVLQVLLILVFQSPFGGGSGAAELRPLLPAMEAITPSRVELDGPDADSIVLERDGSEWRIADLGGFPADDLKVQQLIDTLTGLDVRRPVVSSARYHDSFQVADDDNKGRVRVWGDGKDDAQVDLIVGDSPNYRTLYVRAEGDDDVYEVRGLNAYDIRPTASSWIRRELVDLDGGEVTGLVVTNAKGTFELAKQESGQWKVARPEQAAETPLDQDKIDSLVNAVTSLRLADGVGPVDPGVHGLAEPEARIVLRITTGGAESSTREVEIVVGGQPEDEDTKRYVSRGGSGFTGTAWDTSVKRLLEGGLADLEPAS